jgi:hypothetical protein
MEHLIGKTVIFQTKRKPMRDKTLKPIFPEHTFSAKIVTFVGDFVSIQDVKLLTSEGEYNGEYGRKLTLLARDKLYYNMSPYNTITNTSLISLIKIKNNLYFDVHINNQNTDLLKSIKNHNWFPKLYDTCFYNLSSMEMDFARELFRIH